MYSKNATVWALQRCWYKSSLNFWFKSLTQSACGNLQFTQVLQVDSRSRSRGIMTNFLAVPPAAHAVSHLLMTSTAPRHFTPATIRQFRRRWRHKLSCAQCPWVRFSSRWRPPVSAFRATSTRVTVSRLVFIPLRTLPWQQSGNMMSGTHRSASWRCPRNAGLGTWIRLMTKVSSKPYYICTEVWMMVGHLLKGLWTLSRRILCETIYLRLQTSWTPYWTRWSRVYFRFSLKIFDRPTLRKTHFANHFFNQRMLFKKRCDNEVSMAYASITGDQRVQIPITGPREYLLKGRRGKKGAEGTRTPTFVTDWRHWQWVRRRDQLQTCSWGPRHWTSRRLSEI